jgi:hypothetical protein
MCMKKDMENEEYVKWMFMLGEYYRGQRADFSKPSTYHPIPAGD